MFFKITSALGFFAGCLNLFALNAKDIPIAHTPIHFNMMSKQFVCGYGDVMPAPILADCTEPLVKEAPDLRAMWRDDASGRLERIEQCGNRVVISSKGVIHDMYVLGPNTIGVYDVQVKDLPKCEIVAIYAQFANHKSLNLYLPFFVGSKRVVSRTLVDANTLEVDYNGKMMRYSRVKDASN